MSSLNVLRSCLQSSYISLYLCLSTFTELCQKLLEKDINIKVCFMTSGEINMDAVGVLVVLLKSLLPQMP